MYPQKSEDVRVRMLPERTPSVTLGYMGSGQWKG